MVSKYLRNNPLLRNIFRGASDNAAGAAGAVPTPTSGDQNRFLKGDGSWSEVFPTWSANTRYTDGQFIVQSGSIYQADASFQSGASFNAGNWTGIGSAGGTGLSYAYRAITAVTTIVASDVVIEVTDGTFSQPLPTAVGIAGRVLIVKNTGAGTTTLDGNATEEIDGSTTLALTTNQSATIVSNGANWIII